MEVKPGYKQTEVGVIPEDWVSLTFKDGVAFYIDYRGRTPRKLGMSWGGGDILALSANNVQMGRIDPEKEPTFGSDSLYQKWMCQGHCECGDILLTMEAPLGNVARVPDSRKYILSQRVILVRPHSWIDRAFLSYFMMETYFQNQLQNNSSGTTAKGIQRQKLDLIQVYLPHSKDEQIAIATALSDVDELIESLEKLIAKKRAIKQGAMQELLTGKRRLPGFGNGKTAYKKTEVGEIPEDWEVRPLGVLASLKNGYAFKSSTYSPLGSFGIVTIANVQDGYMNVRECNRIALLPLELQPHQVLKRGDILVSMTGNVGRVCIVSEEKLLLNQRVGKLVPTGVNPEFLFALLSQRKFISDMMLSAKGGAQGNLSISDICSYSFGIPRSLPEQTAIATALSDVDSEIESLETKLSKTRQIKQGMMQELLTGRIRLV